MAKIVAQKPRSGAAAQRVTISWGKFDVSINGKVVNVDGVSRIQKGLYDKLGLKNAAAKTPRVRVVKDKKGRSRLQGVSRVIGSRFFLATLGEWTETKRPGNKVVRREVWYRIRVPHFVSLAGAYDVLKTSSKIKAIKWPNGEPMYIDEQAALPPAP